MARKTKPKCFHCGGAANAAVQTRQLRRTHFICIEKECWDTYYRLADEAAKEKK